MIDTPLPPYDCNACGYDMNARPAGDPCLECGTPFDARRDAPGARTRSMTILVCLWLSLVLMPFLAFFSIVLMGVAWANDVGIRKSLAGQRLSHRVRRRLHLARSLWWTNFAAFWSLMLISWTWPDALNWW